MILLVSFHWKLVWWSIVQENLHIPVKTFMSCVTSVSHLSFSAHFRILCSDVSMKISPLSKNALFNKPVLIIFPSKPYFLNDLCAPRQVVFPQLVLYGNRNGKVPSLSYLWPVNLQTSPKMPCKINKSPDFGHSLPLSLSQQSSARAHIPTLGITTQEQYLCLLHTLSRTLVQIILGKAQAEPRFSRLRKRPGFQGISLPVDHGE